MRTVPAAMTTAWQSVMKGGDTRPVIRATILVASMKRFEYDTSKAPGGNFENERSRAGYFNSIIFGDAGPIRELRNIKSFTWSRSVFQDVATATLVMSNTDLSPVGVASELDPNGELDQPGAFTYNRGDERIAVDRWGYNVDRGWHDVIVPDRLVRTYEGYGTDPDVWPALDPSLMQSGTWLIDKVDISATTGDLTIEMRDVGRLLLDQVVFPPAIPYAEYPLYWSKIRTENVPGRDVTGGSWGRPVGAATSSNELYVGEGLTNPPYDAYVSSNGGVEGHHASHVLRNGDDMYWLSTGQETRNDKVWWEVDLTDNSTAMNGVRIQPQGGPYRVYVSLHNGTKWLGKRKIPYEVGVGAVDVGADIPFVSSFWADRNRTQDITLPRKYGSIKKVRITFGHLKDDRVSQYPWRAGLNDLYLYTAASAAALGFAPGTVLKTVGNYADYAHIVKWICAWSGWYWPTPGSGRDFITVAPGNQYSIPFTTEDIAVLPKGRLWGNMMKTGTAGEADLTVDLFDKKPLLDVINYVRDIVGFNFYIDESGAAIFRMPNLWTLGNYTSPDPLATHRKRTRTSTVLTLDEEETLLDYTTVLDSGDIRERIFVANSTGKFGIAIKSYTPHKVNFHRVAGWTDQRFANKQECRVMADLLAAQSMFNYRRGRATIPGYPAIQIDDQVRIFERVTQETFYHYVAGITSNFDAQSGEWTYTLDTHWLGENPATNWVVRVDELDAVTQAYLNLVGEDDADV